MRSSLISPTAAMKSRQKFAQDFLPIDLAIGDAIELLFEIGGEVIFDVAAEEDFEKSVTSRPLSSGTRRFFPS